jgi:cyanophycin synthetase
MKILDLHILNGPNYWSVRKHKLIIVKLDIEELEEFPTNRLDGFYEALQKKMPTLYNHYCSEGHPGGFFERVKKGTWIGHVFEHIALELQSLAGMECGFGRTRQAGSSKGIYNVALEFQEERAGIYAVEAAFKFTEALVNNASYNIKEDVEKLKSIYAEYCPGPSTTTILNAAKARGIPYIRLDEGSLFQLGYGINQKRINSTITENTSNIAVDLAGDKYMTKKLLKNASVPVSEGVLINQEGFLEKAILDVGYPLVIKPLNSNHGKGVTINVKTWGETLKAFKRAKVFSEQVIVEKYYPGEDYRLLVINYKLAAAAHRVPARVKGDGILTVKSLIEKANRNPMRGESHEKILTKIKIDDHTLEVLSVQGFALDSVPPTGKIVFVKQTANLSTGGTSEDVTEFVHPEIVKIAERTALTIGLDICGIDMVLADISQPMENNGVIVEVNAAPGFRMHAHPSKGKSRPVGEHVVNMLFPQHNGRIPITAITGTNGKTTTTRLLAHIAKKAGFNVGYTTTEGIHIGDTTIEEGDCTGPVSARKILCNRTVNFAILECARGGMLRAGLAFDTCDVGIVTNVAEDHIGLKDIETVEEMAKVKSVVAESVKPDGYAVLNADNDLAYRMKDNVKCNVALFSTDPLNERIKQHTKNGGLSAIYENNAIVLTRGYKKLLIEIAENIPLSFHGKALFMVENIMTATLAAHIHGISASHIAEGLRTFDTSAETNPGRLNTFTFENFTLMIDYAHNYHGIKALGSLIEQWEANHKIGIISVAGDRRDIDIINVGKAAAGIFNKIIIRIDEDKRGRADTEISGLLLKGIREVNPHMEVDIIPEELKAIQHAILNIPNGSLIVNLSEKVHDCILFAQKLQKEEPMLIGNSPQELTLNNIENRKLQHQYESTVD